MQSFDYGGVVFSSTTAEKLDSGVADSTSTMNRCLFQRCRSLLYCEAGPGRVFVDHTLVGNNSVMNINEAAQQASIVLPVYDLQIRARAVVCLTITSL